MLGAHSESPARSTRESSNLTREPRRWLPRLRQETIEKQFYLPSYLPTTLEQLRLHIRTRMTAIIMTDRSMFPESIERRTHNSDASCKR